MTDEMTADNTTIMLFPGWCFETLSAAFLIADPPMTQQQAEQFILQLRNSRLSEVDELERTLGMSTTAEMRKHYKTILRELKLFAEGIEKLPPDQIRTQYKMMLTRLGV